MRCSSCHGPLTPGEALRVGSAIVHRPDVNPRCLGLAGPGPLSLFDLEAAREHDRRHTEKVSRYQWEDQRLANLKASNEAARKRAEEGPTW